MDDHLTRVLAPVLDCLSRFEAGQASLGDVQAVSGGAALALDNAHGDLRVALEELDPELERIAFSVPVPEQRAAVVAAFAEVRHLASAD